MKTAYIGADGDIVSVPCVIHMLIITSDTTGDWVIVKNSATQILPKFHVTADVPFVLDLSKNPVKCTTKCTIDLNETSEVEVGVIYEELGNL